MFKKFISSVKYKLEFLEVLDSPFKGLKLKWYFGDIAYGHPYFYPRKWVKSKTKEGYREPKYIKYFGFTYNILGWKTKYDDYRFEWNPGFSFIIFGKQLFIAVVPDVKVDYYDSYWEAWLTYKNKTEGTNTISKLIQLFDIYSCTWRSYNTTSDEEKVIDHYLFILKDRYVDLYKNYKESKNVL